MSWYDFALLILLSNQLPDDKILDWSKLKQIAEDVLSAFKTGKKVPYRIKNIVRKGKIAFYKQFLVFSRFQQLYVCTASKCGIEW